MAKWKLTFSANQQIRMIICYTVQHTHRNAKTAYHTASLSELDDCAQMTLTLKAMCLNSPCTSREGDIPFPSFWKRPMVPDQSLITTYHPSDHTLRNLVRKNWDILGQSEQTSPLHKKKLTVGYRRPKKLARYLSPC